MYARKRMTRYFILLGMGLGLVLCLAGPRAAAGAENPFFAMDTGTQDARHDTAPAQAAMLKELGYAGIGYTGFKQIPEMLKALDANGLTMFTDYVGASVEAQGSTIESGLEEGLAALKGRGTMIWMTITSKTYPPSAPEGDAQAVKMLRELADKADGLRIALYPHTGTWLERVEDAVRLVKQVDRKNVGLTFNLCHWLNAEKGRNLQAVLESAAPFLFVVTINGADTEGGWDRLIQPLDSGSFDTQDFLSRLAKLGYTGPIGLQGYGIKGDVHENLKRSMKQWRLLQARLGAGSPATR